MKEKLILLTVLLAVYLLPTQAKKVTPQKAEKVANQLLVSEQTGVTTRSASALSLVHTEYNNSGGNNTRSASVNNNEPTYYIFNKGNNNGFIIVSADDVVTPILGYTTTGSYDVANLPVNFAEWTEGLSDEIAYAIDNNLEQSPETKAQWEDYSTSLRSTRATTKAVQPLLKTTWNQYDPYNSLCPDNSYTGCVATAMAQIMKYHNYPKSRTITIPGYTTSTQKYVISALPSVSYDWANMINNYPYFNSTATSTQKQAVAKLMYDCGVSVKMNYTTSASGAPSSEAGRALTNYFNYDKSIQIKSRDYYTNQEWENMLYAEINAGRPIYYAGYSPSSGHAFVCDGYDNSGYFHFNWGWGGNYDGYFITTALNPGTGGAGSGSGTYNNGQEIIVNIKPNTGGVNQSELAFSSTSTPVIDKSTLTRGENFVVDGIIWNKGLFTFSGEYGIAIVDANDKIIAITGQTSADINTLSGKYTKYIVNKVPTSIAPGQYFVKMVYKDTGASSWTLRNTLINNTLSKIAITINDKPVLNISRIIFNEGINLSVEKSTLAQGEYFLMNGYLWNCTGASVSGEYGIALVDGKDQIVSIAGEGTFTLNNYYYTYLTNLWDTRIPVTTAPGNYYLRAVTKEAGQSEWALVNGSASYVNKIPVTVTTATRSLNVQIDDEQSALNIYATQGQIYVHSNESNPIKEVSVYNMSGAMEYHTATNTYSFTSDYTIRPGVYVVKVKTNKGVENKKILIK